MVDLLVSSLVVKNYALDAILTLGLVQIVILVSHLVVGHLVINVLEALVETLFHQTNALVVVLTLNHVCEIEIVIALTSLVPVLLLHLVLAQFRVTVKH